MTLELDKAIEEAAKLGFTNQFIIVNGMVKKIFSNRFFFKEEFAIVKTYPITSLNGYKGTISYIVLSDSSLGYLLKERKKNLKKRSVVEKHAHFEI